MNSTEKISVAYSYLGKLLLEGNVEVVKFLYGNLWEESPPLIRTVSELQECLTSKKIYDSKGLYSPEFLYYWGMICLGEQSPLITQELEVAKICFHAVKDVVPHAEARLAYIKLLQSTEPAKSESNVRRLAVLRQWSSKRDLFSRIVLARISFYAFLCEEQPESSELPITTLWLLELPCQRGHPVAIRFRNDVYTCTGNPERTLDKRLVRVSALYDFENPCKCANKAVTAVVQGIVIARQMCN